MTIGILILSAVCVIQGLLLIHTARENGRLRRRVAAAEDALNTYQVVSIDKRDIRKLRGRQ